MIFIIFKLTTYANLQFIKLNDFSIQFHFEIKCVFISYIHICD